MPTVVESAREALGPFGVCLPGSLTVALNADLQRDAVRRLDHVGYRTVWVNETIGKDAFVQLGVVLAETQRIVVGTCIANIWVRPAQTMHAAAAQLAEAYPGRFVMGLGVGYPEQAASVGQEFGRPLVTMRDYVQRMDEPTWPPVPDAAYPRIIAANGPKMLALAGEIADGAFPAAQAAEFTAQARSTLGPDKLLVVGLALDPDPTVVRDSAHEHLLAGADHVTILPPLGGDFRDGIDQLEKIAPALTGLG
jgi:probable F420-dependent oxidoreductase